MTIQTGDVIPVDGVIIYSNSLACNESSATGEPEPIKKSWEKATRTNPFVLSGSQVEQGTGTIIVTCVGSHSFEGKTRDAILENVQESEETALQ